MSGFLYLCEYLGITPKDFFDIDNASPGKVQNIFDAAKKLTEEQAELILQLINEIISK